MYDFEPDSPNMQTNELTEIRYNIIAKRPSILKRHFCTVLLLSIISPIVAGSEATTPLSEAVPQREQVWLDVSYPEQDSSRRVMGLELLPRTPESQGAVVLLHDKEQHADWPFLIRQLRQSLPDTGWYTFSISLPKDDATHAPKRTRATKQSDEITLNDALRQELTKLPQKAVSSTESETTTQASTATDIAETTSTNLETDTSEPESVDINLSEAQTQNTPQAPYNERAKAHLEAAMKHVQNKGYQNKVLITIGSSAEIALHYLQPLAAGFEEQGFALVMISPKINETLSFDISTTLGKGFRAPVLEIIDGSNQRQTKAANARQVLARAAQARSYQLLELATIQNDHANKTLLKRVDSWLKTYAPGMTATRFKR